MTASYQRLPDSVSVLFEKKVYTFSSPKEAAAFEACLSANNSSDTCVEKHRPDSVRDATPEEMGEFDKVFNVEPSTPSEPVSSPEPF